MRYLTAAETRDSGVLLEVNRRLLHPRGLALELVFDADTEGAPGTLRVQDHRDDPEGVIFGDLDADDTAKAVRFEGLLDDHGRAGHRLHGFGYVVQPLPLELTEPTS